MMFGTFSDESETKMSYFRMMCTIVKTTAGEKGGIFSMVRKDASKSGLYQHLGDSAGHLIKL